MQVQTALLFESPEQIYTRVFRELRPRTPCPDVAITYCRFANANSFIRWEDQRLTVRITDVLEGAPAPIQEALAQILLGKLLRKPVAACWQDRYRRYLNRADIRRSLHLLRQIRGRKLLSAPRGAVYDLEVMFEELNARFFHGLMARPALGWSRRPSRTMLGHYDPSHNAIVLSRLLDSDAVPRIAVEYVLYHEMLHLRHPVDHRGTRRCVHTQAFRDDEKQFPGLADAKLALKQL